MKYILFALLSISAFSQVSICTECLIVEDLNPIELIQKIDIDGNKYSELNTDTSLLDIIKPSFNLSSCYEGSDLLNLGNIIQSLAGNTNESYINGGHELILDIDVQIKDTTTISLDVSSDYENKDYKLTYSIPKCKK